MDKLGEHGIGWAVKQMQDGASVYRKGWNGVLAGKGMWIRLEQLKHGDAKVTVVLMKSSGGAMVPWLCSQSDLLGTDWEENK